MKPRSALSHYLAEIRGGALLSREEEADLALRARAGDREALNRLVEANLGFVVKVAREYRHLGVPFEDLLNEGNLGLLEAARRYDGSRGTKFITFAVWWIRKAILAAVAQGSGLVRLPDYERRRLRRIRLAEGPLPQDALHGYPRTRSLDEPASREGETSLGERLTDDSATTSEEDLLQREAIELLCQTLERLEPQERRVLEYRFGLAAEPCLVLREVGYRMSVSRERVRQIEVCAMRRLRRLFVQRHSSTRRGEKLHTRPENTAAQPTSSTTTARNRRFSSLVRPSTSSARFEKMPFSL